MAESTRRLTIGCIADDFTGAGDAASFLTAGGLNTLLLIWPCRDAFIPATCQAVVVALKSRSEPAAYAVAESLAAVRWLKAQGAQRLYFKYCSTFDSTPQGNIGPVADALLEELALPYTLLCPSLLSNGRSVRGGVLTVNGVPLAESHMSRHPLNPMWASSLPVLMEPQSLYPCFVLSAEETADEAALRAKLQRLQAAHPHFYLVPDYFTPEQGRWIARFFADLPLLTGGSELLEHLARQFRGAGASAPPPAPHPTSTYGRVMLAGSCSDVSRAQIDRWCTSGGLSAAIEPEMLFEQAPQAVAQLAEQYRRHPEQDILFYSSPRRADRPGQARAIEEFIALLAKSIVESSPVDRLIVAGGETSGAVIRALGFNGFMIGPSIAPGVPILYPTGTNSLRIVLKSGNFGQPDFFLTTLKE